MIHMKALIKVDDLELLQSINQLLIVQRGYCQTRFHLRSAITSNSTVF